MTVVNQAIRGVLWAYGTFTFQRLMNLVISMVLARLLIPDDFGLFAGATLIIGIVSAFGEMGIREALIYRSDHSGGLTETAFVLGLCLGSIQWLVIFALAPFGVEFIDDERVVDVLRVLAFFPLIGALAVVPDALIQRRLNFRRRYQSDLMAIIVKTGLAITLAYHGHGVWSLVFAQLASMFTRTLTLWLFSGWSPSCRLAIDKVRMILGYGIHILAVNLMTLLATRSDQFFIASILGQEALGFYFIGATVPEVLLLNFSLVLTRVIFPTFAAVKDSNDALVNGLQSTIRYAAFFTVPMALGMVAVAPEMTLVLFGEQWLPCIPLVRLLALTALMRAIPWSLGDALKAIGRPDLTTKLTVIYIVFAMPMLWSFVYFGESVVMAALAMSISTSLSLIGRLWFAAYFFKYKLRIYLDLLGAPVTAGVGILVVVTLWRMAFDFLPDWALLITSVCIGAVTYAGLMWFLARDMVVYATTSLRDAIRRKPPGASMPQ